MERAFQQLGPAEDRLAAAIAELEELVAETSHLLAQAGLIA